MHSRGTVFIMIVVGRAQVILGKEKDPALRTGFSTLKTS